MLGQMRRAAWWLRKLRAASVEMSWQYLGTIATCAGPQNSTRGRSEKEENFSILREMSGVENKVFWPPPYLLKMPQKAHGV